MKSRRLTSTYLIAPASVCLIGLTWLGMAQAAHGVWQGKAAAVSSNLANRALSRNTPVDRQVSALDQTPWLTAIAYEGALTSFNPVAWQNHAVVLNGLSRDTAPADENGTICQLSVAEAVSQNVPGGDDFEVLSKQVDPVRHNLVGLASVGAALGRWHMSVARALHCQDRFFAGVVNVDRRIASIIALLGHGKPRQIAFQAVVGLRDVKSHGAAGPRSIDLVSKAVQRISNGTSIGPSLIDATVHVHAFQYWSGHALAVIVAMDQDDAMRPATIWRQQANLIGGCVIILFAGMGLQLVRSTLLARRREAALAGDRAVVAFANAQLEIARAVATAKAEQLEATLAGMTDGVSMFDAQMRLVEWNAKFPEVAGVPADILRVGLPMEEILHAQIKGGQFGQIAEPEAEVRRRMLRVRTGQHSVVQRQRPDGHTLELRRKRLPEGGFVTLYADVTDHKRAEEALRDARIHAEAAAAAKSRFAAIVSHEIRIPLDALLNTLRALTDGMAASEQQPLLATARKLGDVLLGLTNDILEMAQFETSRLMIRPALFELQPLMKSSVEMFAVRATERGITIRTRVAEKVPATLYTDVGRLRQVLLNLLSYAVEYGASGEIRLEAEIGRTEAGGVTLLVKNCGPPIDATMRSHLFHPLSRLAPSNVNMLGGSRLGLSVCQELVALMGGFIGCESWNAPDGQLGNAFWLSLPASAVAAPRSTGREPFATDQVYSPCRQPPRTHILLVENRPTNPTTTAILLRRDGHLIDVVSSGKAAIKAVERLHYDIVLMDAALPGLARKEVTNAIRSLTEPVRSMPIIAFATNASPEINNGFQVSEMGGYFHDPLSMKSFSDVLHAYVWSGHRLNSSRAIEANILIAGSIRPELTEPDSRHPVLSADRILELRNNLAPQTFMTLIEECLVDLASRLPGLQGAFAAGSTSAITIHSHAMVGMAAGYGMETLETSLRTIMAAARAGDTSSLGLDAIAQVERELASATRALRAMLQHVVA